MRALGNPPFKQLRDKVVQSKRTSSFAREFSHNYNYPKSIVYNRVEKSQMPSVKTISGALYKNVRVYEKIIG